MTLTRTVKLGRIRPAPHRRLRRARMGPSALPPAPESFAPAAVQWGMFGNDKLSDCVPVAYANLSLQHASFEERPLVYDDTQIKNQYFYLTNGQDTGLVETDALASWQENGFPLDGRERLASVVAIDPHNVEAVKSLCAAFRGLYVGAELPTRAQWQDAWSVPVKLSDDDVPGSWGGHAMALVGFDEMGPLFATWGRVQRATWLWFTAYVSEAYVIMGMARACSGELDGLALDLAAAVAEDGV